MRLISWNVNGLRACLGKGFIESMRGIGARLYLYTGDEDAGRTS